MSQSDSVVDCSRCYNNTYLFSLPQNQIARPTGLSSAYKCNMYSRSYVTFSGLIIRKLENRVQSFCDPVKVSLTLSIYIYTCRDYMYKLYDTYSYMSL